EASSHSEQAATRNKQPLGTSNHQPYAKSAGTSSIETFSFVPAARSHTSAKPSAASRPITTTLGTPSSSASPNFTPGDTFGRSSKNTSTPASDSVDTSASAFSNTTGSLPVATTCTSNGAISRGQISPRSS